jgi:riboflavin biosynthesis pyrimidine reductase
MLSMSGPPFQPDIPSFLEALTAAGPITVAVMVTSVDGRATVSGRVGGLTGSADQQVLLGAREVAAAIVVGGNTVSAEGYDRLLGDEARARRQAKGLPAEPELVIFTRASPPLPALWSQLRERYPDGLIVENRLLDQFMLGISPHIVGDDSQKRVLEHAGPLDVNLNLLGATASESFLFLRYGLAY